MEPRCPQINPQSVWYNLVRKNLTAKLFYMIYGAFMDTTLSLVKHKTMKYCHYVSLDENLAVL